MELKEPALSYQKKFFAHVGVLHQHVFDTSTSLVPTNECMKFPW